QLPEAIKAYQICLKNEPNNGDAAVELAMTLMYVDESQAESAANEAINKQPNDGRGYGVLGLIACRRSNWSDAYRHLQTAVNLAPSEAWIQANFAWACGKCGKWQQAEIAANRAVELDNQLTFALGLQAWIAIHQEEWKSAIRYATPAIFKSKQSNSSQDLQRWVYPCLIVALEKAVITRQATDIERRIKEFISQVPNSAFAWGFQGWKQAKQGLFNEALTSFQQATSKPQVPGWILINTGITQEKLQNFSGAIQVYETYLQKIKPNPFVLFRLGTLLAQTGQWKQGRSHLEKAIHLNPNYPEAYHNLGWVLLNIRNADGEIENSRELLSAYRRAFELYNNQYKHTLAQVIQQAFQSANVEL
ncbi:MAG: tetratricopeptide repeat protein, partial [Halothece sp.]